MRMANMCPEDVRFSALLRYYLCHGHDASHETGGRNVDEPRGERTHGEHPRTAARRPSASGER